MRSGPGRVRSRPRKKTISGGILDGHAGVQPPVILAALAGAIVWNVLTWLAGIPSSSSHALVGGLIGAAVVAAGCTP